jgi:YVTN family beta-propeller protein
MKKNLIPFLSAGLFFIISACNKDDNTTPTPPVVTTGLYVLNEGLFNGNNTMLTYYNFSNNTQSTDFFANVNSSSLGDTGNDIVIYGGKLYIVMNVSSYIEVADAFTAHEITKIDMKNGSVPRQPRYAVGYKNKLLVSSYDGTVAVIDTTTLTIDKFITVGSNPEQLVVANDKLFVANSGGLNFPDYDSTVSVVDLSTFTEKKKIVVGLNPGKMAADENGNVFVVSAGNYVDAFPKIVQIDASGESVKTSLDSAVNIIKVSGDKLYAIGGYGVDQKVLVLNTADLSVSDNNFISDGTIVTSMYGLDIDNETGDVYITDSKDYTSPGEVFCFDKNGAKKFSFSVTPGMNPDKVVFIKQ